jgi:hypothetical protein
VLGGKFRIVEAIGQGSAGPIFKAERLDSGGAQDRCRES